MEDANSVSNKLIRVELDHRSYVSSVGHSSFPLTKGKGSKRQLRNHLFSVEI